MIPIDYPVELIEENPPKVKINRSPHLVIPEDGIMVLRAVGTWGKDGLKIIPKRGDQVMVCQKLIGNKVQWVLGWTLVRQENLANHDIWFVQ